MTPESEIFTYEILSSIYRQEMSSPSLTKVRKDLYKRMVSLTNEVTDNLNREVTKDPDSTKAMGAYTLRKNTINLCKSIKTVRANKIASLAIRSIGGFSINRELLCSEEIGYYNAIIETTNRFFEEVSR